MNKAMLVLLNADKDIPSEFLDKVLKDYPAPFGCACVQTAGEILWEQKMEGATLAGILQMLDHFKATNRILIFGGAQGNPEDLQPYHLLSDANNDPEIVGFLVGDFPAYHMKESSKSDAFIAMESVVVPTILQFSELCDGDVDKIMNAITKPNTAQDFHAMFGTSGGDPVNGALAILGKNGQLKLFNDKAAFGADTDWGWTSKVYDTTEKAKEVPITARKGGMGLSAPAAPKVTQLGNTTIIHKGETPTPPKTDTAPPKTDEAMIQVPHMSNKQLKAWFNEKLGYIPEQFHKLKGRTVPIPGKRPDKPTVLKDLRELNPDAPVGDGKVTVTSDPPVEEKPKDVEPHHVPVEAPKGPVTSVPVIPAGQLKDFMDKFMKSPQIVEAMKGSVSLESIGKLEKIVPNFSKQTGVDLQDTFTWEWSAFQALAKEYPQLLAVMCINYRNELIKFFLASPKKDKDEEDEIIDLSEVA